MNGDGPGTFYTDAPGVRLSPPSSVWPLAGTILRIFTPRPLAGDFVYDEETSRSIR